MSLGRLVSWINHMPPACWSTFWKSIFKHQLAVSLTYWIVYLHLFCILTYAILRNDTPYHFWLYLNFLNILYFFKYSCANIFHRRSLCTFHMKAQTIRPLGMWKWNKSKWVVTHIYTYIFEVLVKHTDAVLIYTTGGHLNLWNWSYIYYRNTNELYLVYSTLHIHPSENVSSPINLTKYKKSIHKQCHMQLWWHVP